MTPEQLLELEAEMDLFLTNGFNLKHNILQGDEKGFWLPHPTVPHHYYLYIGRDWIRMDHEVSRVYNFRSTLLQRLKDGLVNDHYGVVWLSSPEPEHSRLAWGQNGRCGRGFFQVPRGEIEVTCLLKGLNKAEVEW